MNPMYVVVLLPFMKSTWPLHLICPSSGCMWLFSFHLWSWPDPFTLSSFSQLVCGSLSIYEVHLIPSPCLSFLRLYVIVLFPFMKSTWPLHLICPSSGCMWLFSFHLWSWPDPFTLFSLPQAVCGCSLFICEVDLIPSPCLPFLSMYVVVLLPFMKFTWPFHLFFPSLVCMWLFSFHLWSQPDPSPCLPFLSMCVVVLPSVKSTWPQGWSAHPKSVCTFPQSFFKSILCLVRLYVIVCTFQPSDLIKFLFLYISRKYVFVVATVVGVLLIL